MWKNPELDSKEVDVFESLNMVDIHKPMTSGFVSHLLSRLNIGPWIINLLY